MAASKRPSTSSLRRFITSRPYVTVAELRRKFALDDPDAMACLGHHGRRVFVGLPEREAQKLEELIFRGEIGLEMSVEVRAPVAVGVYPTRIARYLTDVALNGNGTRPLDGVHDPVMGDTPPAGGDGPEVVTDSPAPVVEASPQGMNRPRMPADGEPGDEQLNGSTNGHATPPARLREQRSKGHNGRPMPHRHRRLRNHRSHGASGQSPGSNAASGPQ